MLRDDAYYENLAGILQALANPVRLKILDLLVSGCLSGCTQSSGECCVLDIHTRLGLPQPLVSKHLKILKQEGVLKYRREGNRIIYSFARVDVLETIMVHLQGYRSCCGGGAMPTGIRAAPACESTE